MAFTITTPNLGYQRIEETRVAQSTMNPGGRRPGPDLGAIIQAVDPVYGRGTFIYLAGVASTVIGSAVVYSPDDFTTVLASTSTTGFVAIAMAANVLGSYGWYQIVGKGVAKAATVVDNARVWATATPGTLDDATADGYLVHNAIWGSADGTPSAGLAEIELLYPYIDGITTND